MRRGKFAQCIAYSCEWLDEHIPHRAMWLPGRRLICSAADTSYGWGPGALDWDAKATWLDRWLDRKLGSGGPRVEFGKESV